MNPSIASLQLSDLRSEHRFSTLPDVFFTQQLPQPITHPRLVVASRSCAELLGIDVESLGSSNSINILAGAKVPDQWTPLAMKYVGHQFGYLNPDLGDGRGLLMAQIKSQSGEYLDLHLKGSGTTPYSRDGDGRAVLRSSIREFLASEALAALGVPTTRALAVVTSDTPVYRDYREYRETKECAATLLRVARSHIRFGHFEFAYRSGKKGLTQELTNFVIEEHYPDLTPNQAGYRELFRRICVNTACMIADWQSLGFVHGVMNTDNMSIFGETFDFGPFGFMDRFRADYISNQSDHSGRYAFDRQPAMAHWNLSVLAQALTPVLEKDALTAGLSAFGETFNTEYLSRMRAKLGLFEALEEDAQFIHATLQMLEACRLDYPIFFRTLSSPNLPDAFEAIRNEAIDPIRFDDWSGTYRARLAKESCQMTERSNMMLSKNPRIVLRNYLAQNAIEAAERQDFSVVKRLHQALSAPFAEHSEFDDFAGLPPEGSEELEISCSS